MGNINRWNNFLESIGLSGDKWDFSAKERNINTLNQYTLIRTQEIFRYENLPDTIPAYILEIYLQTLGACIFTKEGNNYYVFFGGFGGFPDEYYRPTEYIVANPYLELNKNYVINKDCVLLKNDALMMGLIPLMTRYNKMLIENELTIYLYSVLLRNPDFISANNDNIKASAEKYLSDLEEGKLGIMLDSSMVDMIKTRTSTIKNNVLQSLIEVEQYFKASLFNEIGINSNFNLKRESLTESENRMNDEVLLPLIDNMLRQREEGVERINSMYGLDIKVYLDSSWAKRAKEIDISMSELENAFNINKNEEIIDDELL